MSMKKSCFTLLALIVTLIFIPAPAKAASLNSLTAATGTNFMDNGNFPQAWTWNSLTGSGGGAYGLSLGTNGTAATNGQAVVFIYSQGANSNSGVTSYNALLVNSHTGTNSTNYGAFAEGLGGTTNNYGLYGLAGNGANPNAGDAGVWGDDRDTSGATYGVKGTNASPTGYAGYFNNSNGGYAAAFMGGKVGIGTALPQSLVHAYGGEVQVGSSGTSCSSLKGGAIRFSSSTLYYCDGSTWQSLTSSSGGLPALTNGNIWIGNASNVATANAMSGDCTITNAGVITCTKTNGVAFGTLATQMGVNLSTQATGTLQAGQFPALTGDVTTTAGSLTTSVAAIQSKTVSGTTGTGNVVFSASPILSGNVGIGTSTATSPLTVNGVIESQSGGIKFPDGTTQTTAATGGGGSGTVSSGTAGQVAYYQSTGTTVIGTSAINIVNGNVGIGTTSPRGVLQVSGVRDGVYFTNPDFVDMSTGSGIYMATGAASGDVYSEIQAFQQGNSATNDLILQPFGGNVGVFNSSPSYALQVNGAVAGTSAYVNTSDARYKKNVQPLAHGLDAVMHLKPVSFEWKDEVFYPQKRGSIEPRAAQTPLRPRPPDPAMRGQQIGFVAQDVEKVLPSVVVTEDNDEKTKGMKYSEIIPVLVKAIQEQQAEIAALKSKLGTQ